LTNSLTSRSDALSLLRDNLKNENLIKHCLASEAVLRALACDRGEDAELWARTGLLHDLDYELTADTPETHGLKSAEMLTGILPDSALYAIKSHNFEHTGVERKSDLDLLLSAGESITGLIVAVALVYPDRKIGNVKVKSITKRMKMAAFARSVSRENIRECEKAGYELRDFIQIALDAMKIINEDLGL